MANKKTKKIWLDILYPVIVVIATLLIWEISAVLLDATLVLPSPKESFLQFFEYFGQKEFWQALGYTFWRSIYSFAIAFVVAMVLALVCIISVTARKLVMPLVAIVRSIPTMSIILILVICVSPKIAPAVVAVIVTAPTLFSVFLGAFDSVDKKLVQMSKVYKVSLKDRITKLYLPNMAGQLFEGCAGGFSLNVKLVIAAEALAYTSSSIGKLMQFAKINIEPIQLFALTLFAVLLGVLTEAIIRFVGKKVVKWQ